MNEDTSDLFAVARCYYDSKEHERVDHLLRFVKHPKARFLGLYSRFLVSGRHATVCALMLTRACRRLVRSGRMMCGYLGKVS